MRQLRKIFTSCFIGAMLCLMVFDVLPNLPSPYDQIQETISERLNVIALAQGVWELYAPDPARENSYFVAELHYKNGEKYLWRSPRWHEVSSLEKFAKTRHVSYFTFLPEQGNRAAWPAFADYLARSVAPKMAGAFPEKVVFISRRATVPEPNAESSWQSTPKPLQYSDHRVFFEKDY